MACVPDVMLLMTASGSVLQKNLKTLLQIPPEQLSKVTTGIVFWYNISSQHGIGQASVESDYFGGSVCHQYPIVTMALMTMHFYMKINSAKKVPTPAEINSL